MSRFIASLLATLLVPPGVAGADQPVVLVAAVEGEVEVQPALERSATERAAAYLQPLAALYRGDRLTGRGVVLAVCPDGSEVRLEPPRRIDTELCGPSDCGPHAAASPDAGRWATVDSALLVVTGARHGEVAKEHLGTRPILLSPRCPEQAGSVAACADWWQPPDEISWLGVADAETYVLTWSGEASAARVRAASACGTRVLGSWLPEVPGWIPRCRTPWPSTWRITEATEVLQLTAWQGRFRPLQGHDEAVLRLRHDATGPRTAALSPRPLARALTLARARSRATRPGSRPPATWRRLR